MARMRIAVLKVFASPAIVATAVFALGGVGFALAQLLFARALPPAELALISLVLAINQVGSSAGTLGIEVPINRHQIPATWALLTRTIGCAAPIALICAITGFYGYGMSALIAALTGVTIVASSTNSVAAALYRSRRQFAPGLMLTQLQNYALLGIGGIAFLLPSSSASNLTALIALAYGIGAAIGWFTLRRRDSAAGEQGPSREQVAEGLYAFGFSIAGMIMLQFERLIIPGRLTMADLAVFSVASALATSPFRMLQIGVGFTLLPRLRACRSVAQIRALLIKEGAVVAGATVVLIAAVLVVAPYVLSVFLKGRYHIGSGLLTAIFVVGIVRIGSSFAVSCVQALGHRAQFRQLTVGSWVSVATSLLCATVCSRFGLTGIVYGVGAGWLSLTLVAAGIAVNIDSTQRFSAPAETVP